MTIDPRTWWDLPLSQIVRIITQSAAAPVTSDVTVTAAEPVEKPSEGVSQPAVETVVSPQTTPEEANAALAIHLSSPQADILASQLLDQTASLQTPIIEEIPNTDGDAALAKRLADEEKQQLVAPPAAVPTDSDDEISTPSAEVEKSQPVEVPQSVVVIDTTGDAELAQKLAKEEEEKAAELSKVKDDEKLAQEIAGEEAMNAALPGNIQGDPKKAQQAAVTYHEHAKQRGAHHHHHHGHHQRGHRNH